jgi:hypothetical protein
VPRQLAVSEPDQLVRGLYVALLCTLARAGLDATILPRQCMVAWLLTGLGMSLLPLLR